MNNQYISIKYLRISNRIGFVYIIMKIREVKSILILLNLNIRYCSSQVKLSNYSIHNMFTCFYEELSKLFLLLSIILFCYDSLKSIENEIFTSKYDIFGLSAELMPNYMEFFTSYDKHRLVAYKDLKSTEVYLRSIIFLIRMNNFPSIFIF